ncbi:hypothetical protein [[Clostridium] innocuum]|nr:hypothetical protein [[Clostridium] innocuum]MCR0166386.1 hypothetical protein [[Clostridium] innocuum]MCR0187912.1 hypothetical protein [[Clostridium] innocuum]MCR0396847.1 hypothetical protein [[Clostridium] innocuum]UOX51368.1 hypothetical protein K5I27_05145 [[Clostridium] innocuum]
MKQGLRLMKSRQNSKLPVFLIAILKLQQSFLLFICLLSFSKMPYASIFP